MLVCQRELDVDGREVGEDVRLQDGDEDLEEREREAEGQTFCGYTQDHREGVAAFFEKREARFTGT